MLQLWGWVVTKPLRFHGIIDLTQSSMVQRNPLKNTFRFKQQEARTSVNNSSSSHHVWLWVTYKRLAVKCQCRWTSGLWAAWTAEPQTRTGPGWWKHRPELQSPAPPGGSLQQQDRKKNNGKNRSFCENTVWMLRNLWLNQNSDFKF